MPPRAAVLPHSQVGEAGGTSGPLGKRGPGSQSGGEISGGTRDGYSDRCGHQPARAGLIGATALRKQPSSAPMQAAEMFSAA